MSAPVYPVTRTWFGRSREVALPAEHLPGLQRAVVSLCVHRGPQGSAEMRDFLVRRGLANTEQAEAVARCVYASLRSHALGRLMDDDFLVKDTGCPIRRFATAMGRAWLQEQMERDAIQQEARAA